MLFYNIKYFIPRDTINVIWVKKIKYFFNLYSAEEDWCIMYIYFMFHLDIIVFYINILHLYLHLGILVFYVNDILTFEVWSLFVLTARSISEEFGNDPRYRDNGEPPQGATHGRDPRSPKEKEDRDKDRGDEGISM